MAVATCTKTASTLMPAVLYAIEKAVRRRKQVALCRLQNASSITLLIATIEQISLQPAELVGCLG